MWTQPSSQYHAVDSQSSSRRRRRAERALEERLDGADGAVAVHAREAAAGLVADRRGLVPGDAVADERVR